MRRRFEACNVRGVKVDAVGEESAEMVESLRERWSNLGSSSSSESMSERGEPEPGESVLAMIEVQAMEACPGRVQKFTVNVYTSACRGEYKGVAQALVTPLQRVNAGGNLVTL